MNETEADLDKALKEAESTHGPDSLQVAACMEKYAKFLRETKSRMLDAANMEARARVICSKHTSSENTAPGSTSDVEFKDSKKCPYCAELIKADAIICRFCKTDLQKKPKNVPVVVLGAALSVALGVIAWLWLASPIKRDASSYTQASGNSIFSSVAPKSKISGAAWIVKGAGQSDIQRGLEIALCKQEVSTDIDSARQNIASQYSTLGGKDYFGLSAALPDMSRAAARDAVKAVKTDVDGKYVISDVPPGNYYIYAAYATDYSACYWLLPIAVTGAEELKIDIENGNMTESHNKSSPY